MTIYHKIDDYYGVLVDGMTMFSGSYEACYDYVVLMKGETYASELSRKEGAICQGRCA
ncbi:hypothetical protein SCRES1_gp46 [Synechococcus phage S-CRES1]|nr:hypothetical protein SCRES1_gp46 [Synechococcus phage S-CRES1]